MRRAPAACRLQMGPPPASHTRISKWHDQSSAHAALSLLPLLCTCDAQQVRSGHASHCSILLATPTTPRLRMDENPSSVLK